MHIFQVHAVAQLIKLLPFIDRITNFCLISIEFLCFPLSIKLVQNILFVTIHFGCMRVNSFCAKITLYLSFFTHRFRFRFVSILKFLLFYAKSISHFIQFCIPHCLSTNKIPNNGCSTINNQFLAFLCVILVRAMCVTLRRVSN